MSHKFELDYGGSWLKCEGVNNEASIGRKKCHQFTLKDEGAMFPFLTPTSVKLVPGNSVRCPWLFGPATRLDTRSVIYPCTRYRCSLPCPCLLCRRGRTPRCCVASTHTQPCNCADCTAQFLDHNSFHGVYHFGCKYCSQLIENFPNLNFNLFRNIEKFMHPGGIVIDKFPLQPTYVPKTQGKKWNTEFLFSGSWKRVTDNWEKKGDDDNFWCKHCNTLFWSFEMLRDHVKLCHIGEAEKIFRHHYIVVHCRNTTRETPKEFNCDQCSASYSSSKYLKRHEETIHHQESYECSLCGKVFTRMDNLSRHQQFNINCVEDKDNFIDCEICDDQYLEGDDVSLFSRKDSMLRHVRTVHEHSEDYNCDCCKQEFSNKFNLERHKRTSHTVTEKEEELCQFGCKFCELKFSRKESLTRHLSVHSETKFTCKQCGKQFSRQDSLRRHYSVHQKENNKFECKLCHTNFTVMTNLQRHKEGFYNSEGLAKNKCDVCDQEYCTSKILRKHVNSNH